MAVTLSAETSGTTAGATTCTVTVTAASGTVMVAVCHLKTGGSQSVTSITDTGSNTWTVQQTASQAGANDRVEVWTAPVTSALSSGTVTVTYSVSLAGRTSVSVWAGADPTPTVDVKNGGGRAATTTPAAYTVTTTVNGDVLVGGISYPDANAPSAGPGTGFTRLSGGSPSTAYYGDACYQITTTTGTYGPTWTLPSSVACGQATVALKPASGTNVTINAVVAAATMAAPTPSLVISPSLSTPASAMTMAALVPLVMVSVLPPTAAATMASPTPSLVISATVSPPAATMTIAAPTPSLGAALDLTIHSPTATVLMAASIPVVDVASHVVQSYAYVPPRRGRFTFVLCSLSGEPLGAVIAARARKLSYAMNGVHSAEVALSLDDPLAAFIQPGLSRLKVYRTPSRAELLVNANAPDVLCFYGYLPPQNVRDEAADNATTLVFQDPRLVLPTRYSLGTESFTATDVGAILWSLINTQNNRPGGDTWIRQGGTTVGVTADRTYDRRPLADLFTEMTQMLDGPDYDVDPLDGWDATGSRVMANLRVFDQQGSTLDDVVFAYGEGLLGNVQNMSRTYQEFTTYATLTATDATTSSQVSQSFGLPQYHTFGLYEAFGSAPDVIGQTQLYNTVVGYVLARENLREIVTIGEPLTNAPQALTDYYLGDTVFVSCRRGSMVFTDRPLRIHGIAISIDQTGYEAVSLTTAP